MRCFHTLTLLACSATLMLLTGCSVAEGEASSPTDINGIPEPIYRAWEAKALWVHNDKRRRVQDQYRNYKTGEVSIEALPELTWSDTLSRQAAAWTNQCPELVPAGPSRRDGVKPSIAPTPPGGVGVVQLIKGNSGYVPADQYDFAYLTGPEFERQVSELRPQMTRDGVPISKSEATKILREQIRGKIEWTVGSFPFISGLPTERKCDEAGRRPGCNDHRQVVSRSTREVGCAITRCLSDEPKMVDNGQSLYAEWVPVACFYTPLVDPEAAPY